MTRAAATIVALLVSMAFAGTAAPAEPARPPAALEQRVRLLAAELELDADQQNAVRQILERQRTQTWRIWNSSAVPPEYRIKATQSVAEEAANSIRSVLNEQQRERYAKSRPRAAETAASRANVEEWLRK